MTDKEYLIGKFDGAVMLLPRELRRSFRELPSEMRLKCEELRLRVRRPPAVVISGKEEELRGCPVTDDDIEAVLTIATKASFHAAGDSIKQGFITADGGYRIGICGETATCGGQVTGYRTVTSLCIRIPRQIKSVQIQVRKIFGDKMSSVLIISPPGGGKTTFLRELVRYASDGGRRVALVDERGEVAAAERGVPQMDVGKTTDVLCGCGKAAGVMMVLRSMNPEIVALDEITAAEDTEAVKAAANCGVYIFATVHGSGVEDLCLKPLYRELLKAGVFETAVVICGKGELRRYTAVELEGLCD